MIGTNELVGIRRDLHRMPEVGLHLPQTQRYVLERLAGLGYEVSTGDALSSVTAVLRGGAARGDDAQAVLLRTDMDALPVEEQTDLDFAASNGAMHACGHDLHLAMLLGTATELARRRDELAGDVVLAFQPGEEAHGGARLMLHEGVLAAAGRRVIAAFGVHVLSYLLPAGRVGVRPGAIMSASTLVRIVFRGGGGHGSAPHLTEDPLLAGAMFVPAVTSALARGIDMFDTQTLTFGAFRGGESYNVIPSRVELLGTLRTFDPSVTERARSLIQFTADTVALAHQLDVDVEFVTDTVPTVSAAAEVECVAAVTEPDRLLALERPISVSEDFCWFLGEVPGAFVLLGAQVPTTDGSTPAVNHSPCARFDEAVLPVGHRLQVAWAMHRLKYA